MANHMNRIFFFEGLHGSGKSTLAKKVAEKLRNTYPNLQIVMRSEKPCPLDICRLSVFSEKELLVFLRMVVELRHELKPEIESELMRFSSFENNHYYVNWFEFLMSYHLWDSNLVSYALAHELCDGKAGYELYREVTFNRWKNFAKRISSDTAYLFEGVLLQHPITELLGYYEENDADIVRFINDLLETISGIPTELVYISTDRVEDLLSKTARVRNEQGYRWIGGLIKLTTTCNYGRTHNLMGFDGAVQFCKKRICIERKILDQITINKNIIFRNFD